MHTDEIAIIAPAIALFLILTVKLIMPTTAERKIVIEAIEYVKTNVLLNITAQSIARHFSISKRKLEYGFREIEGVSVYEFIVKNRVAKARELILEDKIRPLESIAKLSGFTTEREFEKAFMRYSGLSPTDLKNAR